MKGIRYNTKARKPMVSVIMPVYNAGKFLVPAVESILKQTYQDLELIIVDDGSTDTSWKTIRNYRKIYKGKVRVYRSRVQINFAGNAATDIGLSHAKGVFMARMDADDVAHSKRIEKQVAFLLRHSEVIMVGSHAKIIDKTGKVVGAKYVPTTHEDIYKQYSVVHPMIHPSIMVRRSGLPNPNKLYQHKAGVNDDYYTFFKLLNYGQFANIDEPLLKYRVHDNNISLQNIKETFLNTMRIRLDAVRELNYNMPTWGFAIMAIQWIIVSLTPEKILQMIYPFARGMKRVPLRGLFANLTKRFAPTKPARTAKKYYTVRKVI